MEKIVRGSDLSADELQTLREIVLRSFLSRGAMSQSSRERLSSLGLVHCAMGGVMPTPAGRIAARM
jgi:hypothetical protein